MLNSLKSMYNKGLEYWHKFSTSGTGRFVAYTFLCLGMACAIAMVICLLMIPGEKQKIIGLLNQFYSGLKNSISKAFNKSTLKGIMAILLTPFKAITGLFKVMDQTTVKYLWILTIVFLFIASTIFYGEHLKEDFKK